MQQRVVKEKSIYHCPTRTVDWAKKLLVAYPHSFYSRSCDEQTEGEATLRSQAASSNWTSRLFLPGGVTLELCINCFSRNKLWNKLCAFSLQLAAPWLVTSPWPLQSGEALQTPTTLPDSDNPGSSKLVHRSAWLTFNTVCFRRLD